MYCCCDKTVIIHHVTFKIKIMKHYFTLILSTFLITTFYGNINFPDVNLKHTILYLLAPLEVK